MQDRALAKQWKQENTGSKNAGKFESLKNLKVFQKREEEEKDGEPIYKKNHDLDPTVGVKRQNFDPTVEIKPRNYWRQSKNMKGRALNSKMTATMAHSST